MSFIHIFIKFKFITFEMSLLCNTMRWSRFWMHRYHYALCNGNGSWQNAWKKKMKRTQASWIFNLNILWMQNAAQFCLYIYQWSLAWLKEWVEMFHTYNIRTMYVLCSWHMRTNDRDWCSLLVQSLLFILNVICCDDSFVQNIQNRDLTLINVTRFSLQADKSLL